MILKVNPPKLAFLIGFGEVYNLYYAKSLFFVIVLA